MCLDLSTQATEFAILHFVPHQPLSIPVYRKANAFNGPHEPLPIARIQYLHSHVSPYRFPLQPTTANALQGVYRLSMVI
jgi:hypothetical protein